MKKTMLIAALITFTVCAFTIPSTQEGKNIAQVNQFEGMYVFTDSKPVAQYDYLGTVKYSGSFGSGQYTEVRTALIKRAKKEFPNGDGLILSLIEGSADKADVVKLK